MNVKTLFRLKFTYMGDDEKGGTEKCKLEVLAQCTNYTEAEMLVNRIIDKNCLERYEECDYEITLTKIEIGNVLVNSVLCEEKEHVMKLSELYFSGEQDGVFPIKVKFFGDKELKEKDVTSIFLVPGVTINTAIVYLKKYLVNKKGYKNDDFIVIGSSLDKAENIYLLPSDYDKKKEDAIIEEE